MSEFEQFVKGAYERTDPDVPYSETAPTLDEIESLMVGTTSFEVDAKVRTAVWEAADDPMRKIIAIGSISTGSRLCSPSPRRTNLLFSRPEKLAEAATGTESGIIVADAMVASGLHYILGSWQRLPREVVPWAASAARFTEGDQALPVAELMGSVHFSRGGIDSSESRDPHDVERYLDDSSLPVQFRNALMLGAYDDARRATYKPHVWQEQVQETLERVAATTTNPLRFDARNLLGVPKEDIYHISTHDAVAEAGATETARRQARIERESDEIIEAARLLIARGTRVEGAPDGE